ncbi:hypothetical protein L9F63_008360, partial [Diploptera punctata]
MAGFIRVRNCCCCGGSLKGAALAIGVFYMLLAILGSAVGHNLLWYGNVIHSYQTHLQVYGQCEEFLFLPLLAETSIVSGIINLLLLYGAITSKSAFIAPWLAWNMVYPFIQLAHVIWCIVILATCDYLLYKDTYQTYEFNTSIITLLTFNAFSL